MTSSVTRIRQEGNGISTDIIAQAITKKDPILEWLIVDQLQNDTAYQRPRKEQIIRKIKEGFDSDLLGVVFVSRRANGVLMAIDGQQRTTALKEMGWGDQLVPCLVYDGLSREDAARIFTEITRNRASMLPQELFRSDLFRGEANAVTINEIVKSEGFHITLQGGHTLHGGIPGVGTLLRIYRTTDGPVLLKAALAIIADAWGTETGPMAEMIEAVVDFEHRYQGLYNRKELIKRLSHEHPRQIASAANANTGRSRLRGSKAEGVGREIRAIYNFKRREENQLPDWELAGKEAKARLASRINKGRAMPLRKNGGRFITAEVQG